MRVLLLLEASGGGAGRHVVDLALGLKARGVEVHLAYGTRRLDSLFGRGLALLQEAGVGLLPLPSLQRSLHPSDLEALRTLLAYARRRGPFSLVHGHSSKGGALARLLAPLLEVPAFYTPHGVVTLSPFLSPLERFAYTRAESFLARFTRLTFAVAPWEEEALLRLGYPKERVRFIPNGVSLTPPSPEERARLREGLGLSLGEKAVGFVGRLDRQKDPLLALEAFARFAKEEPAGRLVVVGDGPLREAFLSRVGAHGLGERVLFLGEREGREVLPALDVLLLTSAYEGMPYVVLEALALGVPIVAAPFPGLGEWLRGRGSALVADSRKAEAIVERLQELGRGEVVEALRRKGVEAVKEVGVARMVEATLEAYLDFLQ